MNRSQRTNDDPIPVVIVGAGPVGVTAATLLGQHGIDCLVLDRWDGVYPQPRAVHLDDEIYRVLVRLGVGEQFAKISRPTRGLQLIDRNHRVFAVFDRSGNTGRHGHPRANMFDQPELEHVLRANLKDQPTVSLRGNVEVTDIAQDGQGRV
jgi:3-(3-hydroxy-phenyl)propionate hydroxylase